VRLTSGAAGQLRTALANPPYRRRRALAEFRRRRMMWPKYRSFDEFERDEIRPGMRLGWSLDNINDPNSIEMDFDEDPFERALLESDPDGDDDDMDSPDADMQ
jgi:hypothetical protein